MDPFIKRKPPDTWKSHVLRGVRWIRAAQNCASRIPPVSVLNSIVWHTAMLKPMGAPLISRRVPLQNWRRGCLLWRGSSWRKSDCRLEMAKWTKGGSGFPSIGFGVGAVAVNTCPSTDESLFCQFSRAFQIFTSIVTIVIVLYVVYILASVYFGSKKSGRWF